MARNLRTAFVALALCLLGVSVARGDEALLLRHAWSAGNYEVIVAWSSKDRMDPRDGRRVETEESRRVVLSIDAAAPAANGQQVLTVVYRQLVITVSGVDAWAFDSRDPGKQGGKYGEMLQALLREKAGVTVDASGQIVKMDGPNRLYDAMATDEAKRKLASALKGSLGNHWLGTHLQLALHALSKTPVAVDKPWEGVTVVSVGGAGSRPVPVKATLKSLRPSPVGRIAQIELGVDVTSDKAIEIPRPQGTLRIAGHRARYNGSMRVNVDAQAVMGISLKGFDESKGQYETVFGGEHAVEFAVTAEMEMTVCGPVAAGYVQNLAENQRRQVFDQYGTLSGAAYDRVRRAAAEADPAEQIPFYTRAIEIDPAYSLAYLNRGVCHVQRNDREQGIRDYNKAIELDPNYVDAYYRRGMSLSAKGEHDAALRDLDKAIALSPRHADAHYRRGACYQARKEYAKAAADHAKALELDPKDQHAAFQLGLCRWFLGDGDGAIVAYTRALELNPNSSATYWNRGLAYLKKGMGDQAVADYNKAIALDPKDPTSFHNRARAHHLRRDWDKAWADVKACRALGGTVEKSFLEQLTRDSGRNE